jgi:hypothetical protein
MILGPSQNLEKCGKMWKKLEFLGVQDPASNPSRNPASKIAPYGMFRAGFPSPRLGSCWPWPTPSTFLRFADSPDLSLSPLLCSLCTLISLLSRDGNIFSLFLSIILYLGGRVLLGYKTLKPPTVDRDI